MKKNFRIAFALLIIHGLAALLINDHGDAIPESLYLILVIPFSMVMLVAGISGSLWMALISLLLVIFAIWLFYFLLLVLIGFIRKWLSKETSD